MALIPATLVVLVTIAFALFSFAEPAQTLITKDLYNSIFLHKDDPACPGKDFYTYESFVRAARCFPKFGATGSPATRRREVAAFLAQISHETTGLCFKEEVSPQGDYCDATNTQWPCVPGKSYKGRGPIQLSWNYNYGQAGRALGFDGLRNPEIIANNSVIAFKTALWFWPRGADLAANRTVGFGLVTNIINGGLECGVPNDGRVNSRIGFYRRYAQLFNVDTGPNLDCENQKPFA
ncbi:Chitinase 10 [Linum grandiflorum]